MTTQLSATAEKPEAPRLPPRWFIRSFWVMHRAVYSLTRGRFGLSRAKADAWGMMRLRTVGRRSGGERAAMVGYLDDGPDLILLATNGMAEPTPAWCLNLQAHPEAWVDLPDGPHAVTARFADGDERSRLWALWVALGGELDAHAAARSREIPVIVLEPRS